MAAQALLNLAEISPNSYLNEPNQGCTVLSDLHKQCALANLLSSPAGDDAEKLYGLFNVALEHGLGSLILDYLKQVG